MNNNSASLGKRIIAYLIDSVMLTVIILNFFPVFYSDNIKIRELEENRQQLNNSYIEEKITYKEYVKKSAEITYELEKEQVMLNVIDAVLLICIYIIVPFFLGGSTIGKKIMRIKIINEDGTKPSLNTLFIRSLFINGLAYVLVALACIFVLNSFAYFIVASIFTIFEFLLVIISFFMISYRHDKQGLHDLIAHTKVVCE